MVATRRDPGSRGFVSAIVLAQMLARARDEVGAMQVSWSVELEIRPGCLDDFEELTGEMVAAARAESGVLGYRQFISDDRQTVYAQECYESSEAAAAHLRKFAAAFGQRAFQPWSSGSALSCSVIQAMNSGPSWGSIGRPITGRLAHLPIGAEPPTQFQVRA